MPPWTRQLKLGLLIWITETGIIHIAKHILTAVEAGNIKRFSHWIVVSNHRDRIITLYLGSPRVTTTNNSFFTHQPGRRALGKGRDYE